MDLRASALSVLFYFLAPPIVPVLMASDIAAYDLQERCGRRATEVFDREYKPKYQEGGAFVRYENYYNPIRKTCVLLLRVLVISGKNSSIILKLSDVNTRKEFGVFLGNIDDGSVTACDVDGHKCNSQADWFTLIKPIVETTQPQTDSKSVP